MAELLVVFRETLEAVLIIGILLTYLKKTNQSSLIPRIWQGVGFAIILSIFLSILIQYIAGGFSGQSEKIFEGVKMILAACVLGSMIIWMARNTNFAKELEGQAQSVIQKGEGVALGIFLVAFIAVFREVIETVLFLYGIMLNKGGLSFVSSIAGAVIACSLGYLIFIQGQKVPLKTFFNVSSILLIFVAAGMMAYGTHELESAGLIADTGRMWDVNPQKLPDGTYPVLHDKGSIGSIFKGLFGWNGDPSYLEVGVWLATLTGLTALWRKVRPTD